ncbi:hypothetical protein JTB14_008537, partial [Gonioctena quinquepunctata]
VNLKEWCDPIKDAWKPGILGIMTRKPFRRLHDCTGRIDRSLLLHFQKGLIFLLRHSEQKKQEEKIICDGLSVAAEWGFPFEKQDLAEVIQPDLEPRFSNSKTIGLERAG